MVPVEEEQMKKVRCRETKQQVVMKMETRMMTTMPAPSSPRPLVVVSAVSEGRFDAGLHDLARQTADEAVADCVRDVAPMA